MFTLTETETDKMGLKPIDIGHCISIFSFQVPFDTIIKNATSKIADTGVMLGATIPTGCGTAWILGTWRPRRKSASVA